MGKNGKSLKNYFFEITKKSHRSVLFLLIGAYALIALLIALSYWMPPFRLQKIGEISKKTISPYESFSYYDQMEIKNILGYIRSSQPYLYLFDPEKNNRVFNELDQFFKLLKLESSSELISELKKKNFHFSESTLFYLRNHHRFLSRYKNRFLFILKLILHSYYIADQYPQEGISGKTKIQILFPNKASKTLQASSLLLFPINESLVEQLTKKSFPKTSPQFRSVLSEILVNLIEPNVRLDSESRNREIQKRLDKSKLRKFIQKDEIIIRQGHKISSESFAKLQAYLRHLKSVAGRKILLNLILSFVLYLFLIYRFINYETEMIRKKRDISLALLFFVLANLFYFIAPYFRQIIFIPEFLLIPFSMLVFILPFVITKVRSAIILLISYSFFILFYPGSNIIAFLNLLILSLLTIYTQKLVKKRYDYFTVSLLVGIINFFFAFLFVQFKQNDQNLSDWTLILSFSFGISFTAAMFSLGLLPILEHFFNIPTYFRLLELSNIATSPLLRELKKKAPGTYTHSILIGDMCSEAAEAIGINPLLVRVGGYYHDIGKMVNPSFFIENQSEKNKHDEIKPTLSVSMIKSHVKLGVEIAVENHLPSEIIDFIREHHGTTAISYFYHQALGLMGDENVKIEDYEYPGPSPRSKGTAILLIADAVEATVRAISANQEKFSPKNILDIIEDTVQKRLAQGQFDHCDITLKELHTVSQVLFRFLSSQYHKRIDYRESKTNNKRNGT